MAKLGVENAEDLNGEEWADVPKYEGLYQVSSMGRVRRQATITEEYTLSGNLVKRSVREPYLLKPTSHLGYCVVGLTRLNETQQFKIHRLVADAFITHSGEQTEVHHIDHDRQNNVVNNLMWVTPEDHEKLHSDRPRQYKYSTFKTKLAIH